MNDNNLIIQNNLKEAYSDIFRSEVLSTLSSLAHFNGEIKEFTASRMQRRAARQQQKKRIAFLDPESYIPRANIRVQDARDGQFEGAVIPADLQRQWIQGTGPAAKPDAPVESSIRNVAYALLSGADGWMFDGEDALGQTGTMSLDNQRNLKLAKAKQDGLFANFTNMQDYGFREYRLDESNMQDVYYRPQDIQQGSLDLFADHIKPGRTSDDLLAQVMLDWGLLLSLKIVQEEVVGKKVFKVAGNSLFACFDSGIDEAFAKEIATEKPLRIVFRDASFQNDTAKENVKQLLKQLSPDTEMKVI